MKSHVLVAIAGVLALLAGSLAAIADQSERFIGAPELLSLDEIPKFACDRLEPPGGHVEDALEPRQPGAELPRKPLRRTLDQEAPA